jgi:hypothetical protein
MIANFWYSGSLDPEYSTETHTPSAAVAGLMAHGYEINHVAQTGFRANEWMPCDLCVIYGMRNNGMDIIEAHAQKGVRSIIVDLGYISRAMKSNGYEGHWQVGLGGLNWLPQSAPSDRFERLGVPYPARAARTGYVLIAEQTPFDASHGMGMEGINAWTAKAVARCEELGLPYKVRRHPMNKMVSPDELPTCPIEDDLAQAGCVYVHNSNVGNDALLAGIPVVCDKNAIFPPIYAELANDELKPDLEYPYPEKMKDYLHRLAYAQWTRGEIASGEAFEYVIKSVSPDLQRAKVRAG